MTRTVARAARTTTTTGTTAWRLWSDRLATPSGALAALGVLLPLLAVLEPVQPLRALAASSVLLVLPGLALARLVGLRDWLLAAVVSVTASLALTVLVATALFYADLWTWQLCVVLLGAVTVAAAIATAYRGAPA